MLVQVGDNPLICQFVCWCGRTMNVVFDTLEERNKLSLSH